MRKSKFTESQIVAILAEGNAVHAVLCAAGRNIRWMMMIRKKSIRLYFSLIRAMGLGGLLANFSIINKVEAFKRGKLIESLT